MDSSGDIVLDPDQMPQVVFFCDVKMMLFWKNCSTIVVDFFIQILLKLKKQRKTCEQDELPQVGVVSLVQTRIQCIFGL